jgi:hypothetical protein
MGGTFSTDGRREKCVYTSVVKPEGKTPLARPKRGREDDIKMDIKETGCDRAY